VQSKNKEKKKEAKGVISKVKKLFGRGDSSRDGKVQYNDIYELDDVHRRT